MTKKFPKALYVSIESDKDAEWFLADADASGLVSMGSTAVIAKYQLVDVRAAKGVAEFGKPRRSR